MGNQFESFKENKTNMKSSQTQVKIQRPALWYSWQATVEIGTPHQSICLKHVYSTSSSASYLNTWTMAQASVPGPSMAETQMKFQVAGFSFCSHVVGGKPVSKNSPSTPCPFSLPFK